MFLVARNHREAPAMGLGTEAFFKKRDPFLAGLKIGSPQRLASCQPSGAKKRLRCLSAQVDRDFKSPRAACAGPRLFYLVRGHRSRFSALIDRFEIWANPLGHSNHITEVFSIPVILVF